MLYEQKIVEEIPVPTITKETVWEIHGLFRTWLSCTQIFKSGKYMEHCILVRDEIIRLEGLANSEMNSETQPTSKEDLQSRLQSDLIDLDIFIHDYMDYVMVYEEGTSREDFVVQFPKKEEVIEEVVEDLLP